MASQGCFNISCVSISDFKNINAKKSCSYKCIVHNTINNFSCFLKVLENQNLHLIKILPTSNLLYNSIKLIYSVVDKISGVA